MYVARISFIYANQDAIADYLEVGKGEMFDLTKALI